MILENMSAGTCRSQKRALDALELELQMVMKCLRQVLGTKQVHMQGCSLPNHLSSPNFSSFVAAELTCLLTEGSFSSP